MTSKYGFGGGIQLPSSDRTKPRTIPDLSAMKEAVEAGSELGFVSREPSVKRKPGPKRSEPQGKVSIPGPKRVIDEFRMFCNDKDITLWEGLDVLLKGRGR